MTKYIRDRKNRLATKEIKDYIIFGQIGGLLFIVIGIVRYLFGVTRFSTASACAAGFVGSYLVMMGVVYPEGLAWFYKSFSFVGNGIGKIMFSILLAVVYIGIVIPVSLLKKHEREMYLLMEWDGEYPGKEISGYFDWSGVVRNEERGTIFQLIGDLVENGEYYLIPVVVILVVLGTILFFVSSSVMAPFIYTLF